MSVDNAGMTDQELKAALRDMERDPSYLIEIMTDARELADKMKGEEKVEKEKPLAEDVDEVIAEYCIMDEEGSIDLFDFRDRLELVSGRKVPKPTILGAIHDAGYTEVQKTRPANRYEGKLTGIRWMTNDERREAGLIGEDLSTLEEASAPVLDTQIAWFMENYLIEDEESEVNFTYLKRKALEAGVEISRSDAKRLAKGVSWKKQGDRKQKVEPSVEVETPAPVQEEAVEPTKTPGWDRLQLVPQEPPMTPEVAALTEEFLIAGVRLWWAEVQTDPESRNGKALMASQTAHEAVLKLLSPLLGGLHV